MRERARILGPVRWRVRVKPSRPRVRFLHERIRVKLSLIEPAPEGAALRSSPKGKGARSGSGPA